MKHFFSLVAMLLFAGYTTQAQQHIPLYKSAIPGAKAAPATYKEVSVTDNNKLTMVSKVTQPELIAYLPAKPNGTAVIICPGGAYAVLSIDLEGKAVAEKFNEIGITAFVLKYRLPSDQIMVDQTMGPLQDALQAIYLVRKNAEGWNLNPNKIGMMGFSAGGHLAASVNSHYNDVKIQNQENISLRPDFSILIYPVISFGTISHAGSVKHLLGDNPTSAQKHYFSNQNFVNEKTPPTFLVHANDDDVVPVKNSLLYNEALVKYKVPAEMHIYQAGRHGFGIANKSTKEDWFASLKNWLLLNQF